MTVAYHVTWAIEVEADSPQEAAEKARDYQTKRGATATVFDVFEPTHGENQSDGSIRVATIDLSYPEESIANRIESGQIVPDCDDTDAQSNTDRRLEATPIAAWMGAAGACGARSAAVSPATAKPSSKPTTGASASRPKQMPKPAQSIPLHRDNHESVICLHRPGAKRMSEREPVTLEFLACQLDRMLADLASLRDDVNVLKAVVQRLDNSHTRLLTEIRATHNQVSRHGERLRRLESLAPTDPTNPTELSQ
jgi:hypothetical protein